MKQSLSKTVTQETKKFLKVHVAVCVALGVLVSEAQAFNNNNQPFVPKGWTLVEKHSNVHIYKKGSDAVALVDLRGGARVRMLQYQAGKDSNGHNTFWSNPLKYWWNQLSPKHSRALVVNGQYFNQSVNPTPFSYSVRDRTWATMSGNPNDHKKPLRQADFSQQGVDIRDAWDDLWVQTSAPDGILGRHPDDMVSGDSQLGRTSLCAVQYEGQYSYRAPVLLIAVATAKTQKQMNLMLQGWKCDLNRSVAMDGSGSSQMKTYSGNDVYGNGRANKPDYRPFPQAIGVFDH